MYSVIEKSQDLQLKNFASHRETLSKDVLEKEKNQCQDLHLDVDTKTGMLNYKQTFEPLKLSYDICYVRHGQTMGNKEPRVFQGQVDYPLNQLTAVGKEQAQEAAKKMEELIQTKNWMPDYIVLSPLNRAIETGSFFFNQHQDIPREICPEFAEMAFGEWDNTRVIDHPPQSMVHLFYLYQNALIRSETPNILTSDLCPNEFFKPHQKIPGESFLDVLSRAKSALLSLQNKPQIQKIVATGRRPRVLFYGHSMIGAAILILFGLARQAYVQHAKKSCLGFDGSSLMPHATPTLLFPHLPDNSV